MKISNVSGHKLVISGTNLAFHWGKNPSKFEMKSTPCLQVICV